MIETSENITISKKNIKGIVFAIIAIFVLWQGVLHKEWWKYSVRNVFRNDVGRIEMERFAGCQPKTMMEEISDADFSRSWRIKTEAYNFNYYDIIYVMDASCPPESDFEIESNYGSGYEGEIWIEKVKKMRDYQNKFLNREFTALQEDLKNGK